MIVLARKSAASKKSAKKRSASPKVKRAPSKKAKSQKVKKVSSKKAKSPKVKKTSLKSMACVRQNLAKYTGRPSPPYPANQCTGAIMTGNDGNQWISKPNKNGVSAWKKL